MQLRLALLTSLFVTLSPLSLSQIPDRHGVRFSGYRVGPPGIEFVDLDSNTRPIRAGGLVGTPSFNAGAIDPVDGDLWAASCTSGGTGGQLIRMTLSGTTLATQTLVVDTGTQLCISSIVFDQSGDLFFHDSRTIWKLDRATSALTVWDTNTYSGIFNAMTIDPSTDRLWVGTFGSGAVDSVLVEYDLSAGPGSGTVISNLSSSSFGALSGLAYDGGSKLYCATFLPPTVYEYDLGTAALTPVPGAPRHPVGHIAFEALTGELHLSGAGLEFGTTPANSWLRLDPSTGTLIEVDPGYNCTSACSAVTMLAVPNGFPENASVCRGDGGDQVGCTNCPCGNNAPTGTIGGCLNSQSTSARLMASGSTSVTTPSGSNTDLRFDLAGGPPSAFTILSSGDSLAPTDPANPCFGQGSGTTSTAFDGLRCATANIIRHGGRTTDSNGEIGSSNSPWGGSGAPTNGIANSAGFTSGQTRFFQAIHRDSPSAGCSTGLNTSQAIGVTFAP